MSREQRLEAANEFIKTIASCGRKFFNHNGDIARLEISPTGRIFFIDDYSKKRIYTHLKHRQWNGFTHGGTLKGLIESLRDFITKGKKLRASYFNLNEGKVLQNPWGYGDDILIVKEAAIKLGIAE